MDETILKYPAFDRDILSEAMDWRTLTEQLRERQQGYEKRTI